MDDGTDQVNSRVVNLNERLVLCSEDFYIALGDAYKLRKSIGLNVFKDKDLRKKSHRAVCLTLVEKSPETNHFYQISQLNFVELSGSEQAVAPSGFQNVRDSAK